MSVSVSLPPRAGRCETVGGPVERVAPRLCQWESPSVVRSRAASRSGRLDYF